ncbi:choice-of-anchor L domain-containing protein [Conexibacter sp. SYSU D00693]|uniref:choice-of-anchor L domain-containing protein n=1 Tax=Conexibacter sp. SYSU D00693 TaxID=2812560 RepID=UPI00196B90E9|nr:choice-of-anchor L domain-containing protein [Conexibacter sp. SYSU D00693]
MVTKSRRIAPLLGAACVLVAVPATADAAISTQSVQQGVTAAQLAQTLAGTGITVANATVTGNTLQAGKFSGGAPLGIDQGVLLSSGDIADVKGPNNATGAGEGFGGNGDADLDALAGATGEEPGTEDASVLEFDATSNASTLSFKYVFGSEEYTEYVNKGFNDVFAFYVGSGNQRVNCATVPGANGPEPVSVDTIHPGKNANLYRDNGNGQLDTQLDGVTTVLTCTAPVTPNQPTHVKLAIADRGDDLLDSAVAIQAGSLQSGPGNQQPTALSAKAALLNLNPLGLSLFSPNATLTSNGAAVSGKKISFTVNKKSICSATTNGSGVATCSGLASLLDIVLGGGYVATFAGDAQLKPSSAKAGIIK